MEDEVNHATVCEKNGHEFNLNHRRGDLFNPRGKWKYGVCLDYTGFDLEEDWDIWKTARKALKQATENDVSGVTIKSLNDYWILVVLEPWGKYSHPVIVCSDNLQKTVIKDVTSGL
jgi:hypothetical protein